MNANHVMKELVVELQHSAVAKLLVHVRHANVKSLFCPSRVVILNTAKLLDPILKGISMRSAVASLSIIGFRNILNDCLFGTGDNLVTSGFNKSVCQRRKILRISNQCRLSMLLHR